MLSFWEQNIWTHFDYVVVGAGIIGLSTAISLKESNPNASVTVLERGFIPSGASTRNAGFACFGSLTEILHDIAANGEEATIQLIRARYEGLQKLRKRLGDKAASYEEHGGYELLFEDSLLALDSLERVNTLLADIFPKSGNPVFHLRNDQIAEFGFDQTRVKALVRSDFEGQIHSGVMMRSLAALAQEQGIILCWGADVQKIEEGSASVRINVQTRHENYVVEARKVAVCTNAFTGDFAKDLGITSGRGQVLVSEPVPNLPFRGVFHFDEGFYYFRNVSSAEGERILLGGGRNLDFATETTTAMELNPTIQQELERLLHNLIAPRFKPAVAQRWAGIMGFHASKLPIVRHISPNVAVGFGCNGMGVALGSTIGEETAQLLASNRS